MISKLFFFFNFIVSAVLAVNFDTQHEDLNAARNTNTGGEMLRVCNYSAGS